MSADWTQWIVPGVVAVVFVVGMILVLGTEAGRNALGSAALAVAVQLMALAARWLRDLEMEPRDMPAVRASTSLTAQHPAWKMANSAMQTLTVVMHKYPKSLGRARILDDVRFSRHLLAEALYAKVSERDLAESPTVQVALIDWRMRKSRP